MAVINRNAFFATLVLLGGLTAALQAQTTFGTIRGRAMDSTGAVVPGVKITVKNTNTGVAKSVESDESGAYEVGYLQPGTYGVTAERAGFKRFASQQIPLSANAVVLAEVRLEVGDVSDLITVSGAAPLIATESAQLTQVKNQRQYMEAPVIARDSFYNMFSLIPGTQPTDFAYEQSFAGGRSNAANYTVDGISMNSVLFSAVLGPVNPSLELIQEVNVQLSGNPAEFGSPGQATIVTKGGDNRFHGSAVWYYNTAGMNARPFFSPTRPFAVTNDYGFSVSGPLRKNRTFYSGAFEAYNYRSAALPNLNLPSRSLRAGDFSKLTDAAGRPVSILDPTTATPFAGSVIPASRLNATALKIQERFYPQPNFGGPESITGNYRAAIKQGNRREGVDVRVDHQISAKNSLFGRFGASRSPQAPLEGGMPTIGFRIQRRQGRSLLLSDTHIFRPGLINELRLGMARNYNPRQGPIYGPDIVKELGLTNLTPNLPEINALPVFAITGFQGISQIAYNTPAEMNYQLQDNVSWIRGRHTLKMGGEVAHHYGAIYAISPTSAYGNVSFTGQYTNNAYADFLVGIPRTATVTVAGFSRDHATNTDYAMFVQDDFKVTPRLTVNLGLRYEYNPPFREQEDRRASFDPATGKLVVPSEQAKKQISSAFLATSLAPIVTADAMGWPTRLVRADRNNFAPRIGAAYKVTADNKTVLRAAYGIFYIPYRYGIWGGLGGGPFTGSAAAAPNVITGGVPTWRLPQMFPSALNQSGTANLQGINPNLKVPYLEQWNVTLEREIAHMGLQVTYTGTKSMQLPISRNINQVAPSTLPFSVSRRPFPLLGTVNYTDNGGTQIYHGLMMTAERRMRNGLHFQVSHTWAKSLTDSRIIDDTSDGTGYLENAYDRRREWGDDTYIRRHRFTANAVYEFPFGGGHRLASRGLAKLLAGGWSISPLLVMQTGQYFTPSFAGRDPANIGTSSGRPDRVANGNLENPAIGKWFDLAAFAIPPVNAGRFGNSGVNILEGPGLKLLSASLLKRIAIREGMWLKVEGTFTNVLNHPNFGLPGPVITTAAGGVIQSTGSLESAGARTGRLGVRLDW